MADIFNDGSSEHTTNYIKLKDINTETVNSWENIMSQSGLDLHIRKFVHRANQRTMMNIIKKHKELLLVIEFITSKYASDLSQPHLFFITDRQGIILKLLGTKERLEALEKINFGKGTSLAMEHAGINAVSLAMQLQKTVVVQGNEHKLSLLSKWSCICVPIRMNREVTAYLDLSFHVDEDVSFAVPMLKQIVRRIEESLTNDNSELKESPIYALFSIYNLTNRENEIAFHWVNNKTYKEIATLLFISEETVKTTIQNVYRKTGINSKSAFVMRFTLLK